MRIAAGLVALVLLLAGCGSTLERRAVEGVTDSWTAGPFFQVPNPLPAAAPGTLIRSERLLGAPDGAAAWRVLYHSRDLNGADIAVSGIVVAPTAPAPPGGRTVVSWAHYTTGIAPRCGPSAGDAPFSVIEGLTDLLHAGYVVAATDYPGMGAAGPPSYLIGTTAGNSVLDAARAARALPEAGAGDQLLLWGHSQGGHAALFAGERAGSYAPELHLLGVAVAAPAAELGALLSADIGDVSGVTIGAYAFTAFSQAYNQPLDSILTPAGVAATPGMAALCLIGQNAQLHDIATPLIGSYVRSNPATTAPWSGLLAANTPGSVRMPVPLFVAQGSADTLVRPETTAAFVARECGLGATVSSLVVPGADHGFIATDALPQILGWFAGLPGKAPSTC